MNSLVNIENDVYGLTVLDGMPVVSSRKVAEMFDKRHDNVTRDIKDIVGGVLKIEGTEFVDKNFIESTYKDTQNKNRPEYLLTRDAFILVAMGFNGEDAIKFKIAYINRFNEMEKFILSRNLARLEYPALTDMIKLMHDEPKFYHFSNEADMINRIVLGMSAKEFRKMHDLAKGESIRDYLSPKEAELIQKLQKVDVGLVATMPDFKERKRLLQAYYERVCNLNDTKLLA